MQPQLRTNARTYSSNLYGRAISNVGDHHWVVDHATWQDGPGEQPSALDHYLSSISACAVLMMERQAKASGVPLRSLDVRVEGTRRTAPPGSGPTTLQRVEVDCVFCGPSTAQAEALVDYWKSNCVIYGSVALSTPEVTVTAHLQD
jgi:uncharacterized OsmC-like protein